MALNSAIRAELWTRKKDGSWNARALPVRRGRPCSAVVKQAHNGWYFGLFGRNGRPLGNWFNGYESAESAMTAAEGLAEKASNE